MVIEMKLHNYVAKNNIYNVTFDSGFSMCILVVKSSVEYHPNSFEAFIISRNWKDHPFFPPGQTRNIIIKPDVVRLKNISTNVMLYDRR